jgi:hypothetical protein
VGPQTDGHLRPEAERLAENCGGLMKCWSECQDEQTGTKVLCGGLFFGSDLLQHCNFDQTVAQTLVRTNRQIFPI